MITPLHAKSHYSFGYGVASPEALVARAAALGYAALALTDIESLAGQPRFHDLCRGQGIRPISSVELRPGFCRRQVGARDGRLVLLARNRAGYRSLCRIVSRRRGGAGTGAEQRAGADPVHALAGLAEGVVALTDDPSALERLVAVEGLPRQHIGLLLVRPGVAPRQEAAALRAARRCGVVVVADPEVVLLDPADHPLHVLQLAVRQRRRVAEVQGSPDIESAERWLRPAEEAARLYADMPEALEGAEAMAGQCRLRLAAGPVVLPGADAFAGAEPTARLASLCRAALERARSQGRCRDADYERRLGDELAVIDGLGYAAYFLVAAEIAAAARARGIPVAPRGSAVGSLVVHLTGIPNIDPVTRGLCFERFLHARRSDPPDIDLDVCSQRRDELMAWVRRRFGPDRVAAVGAHHGFQLRGALREGLTALGMSRGRIDRIGARLPSGDNAETAAVEELGAGLTAADRRSLRLALRLIGKPRQLALHPAGLVVGDAPIADHAPVERAPRGLIVMQYELRSVAHSGLVKLDLLGSRLLSQLSEAARLAGGRGDADPLDLPLNDAATLARLDRADTIGCFQVETPAVRALLSRLEIRGIEDCVAALALVRPGAAGGAAKQEYVRRVQGEARAQPVHPVLAARLRETLGLLLYDEDLMHVLADVGGFSLAAADELRAAIIAAGDDPAALQRLQRHFLAVAREAGAEPALARAVWHTARRFAAYSFAKAHAWSYAVMAYAAVYMKRHHPAAWGCALLNGYGGAYPLRTIAADLQRQGVRLLPPAVNEPALATVPIGGRGGGASTIRIGLGQIKGLTRKSAQAIMASRRQRGRFRSMDDLLARVRLAERESRALILVGACDDLPPLSPGVYPFVQEALVQGLNGELDPANFERAVQSARAASPDDAPRRRYRMLVRIRNELDYLDMHLSAHPMGVLRAEARRLGCLTTEALRRTPIRAGPVRFAGIVAASRRHPLGQGRAMQFLTLEDEAGLIEAVTPPPACPRLAQRVTTPGPYLVDGTVAEDRGHRYLVVADLWPFHERGQAGRTSGGPAA